MDVVKIIAILLTCHNRKLKTLECLAALYDTEVPKDYIINVFLVDDCSTDGTGDQVRTKFPEVNIIQGNGRLFWNRGMRLAWQEAAKYKDFDYYLWLNDDTIIRKAALNALLETSVKYNNKAIVVGSTCAAQNPKKITYGGRTHQYGLLKPSIEPIICEFFNGNIVLFPKWVYEEVGINDPIFRHALGDFDYGLRARKLGVQLIVAPGVIGECNTHETLPVWCNPNKKFLKRLKAFRTPLGQHPEEFFIFKKRHSGFFSACFYYLANHARVFFPSLWK